MSFPAEVLEYIAWRPFVLTRGDMLVMAPNVRHCANPYKKARSYNVLVSNHLVETTAALLGKFDEKNYLAEFIKTSGFLIFHNVHTEVEPLIGDMHDLARRSKSKVKFRVPLLECQGQELLIRLCAHPHDIYVREENVLRENLTEKMLANRIFPISATILPQFPLSSCRCISVIPSGRSSALWKNTAATIMPCLYAIIGVRCPVSCCARRI